MQRCIAEAHAVGKEEGTTMGERRLWAEKRADIMGAPGAGVAYEAAWIRFELGEAVRQRRKEL